MALALEAEQVPQDGSLQPRLNPGTHRVLSDQGMPSGTETVDAERGVESMTRVEAPQVTKKAEEFFTDEDVVALLNTSSGNSFVDRRDTALIRVLIDTGMRVSGLANLRYNAEDESRNDIFLSERRLRVRLKGGDETWVPIGKKAALPWTGTSAPAWTMRAPILRGYGWALRATTRLISPTPASAMCCPVVATKRVSRTSTRIGSAARSRISGSLTAGQPTT